MNKLLILVIQQYKIVIIHNIMHPRWAEETYFKNIKNLTNLKPLNDNTFFLCVIFYLVLQIFCVNKLD